MTLVVGIDEAGRGPVIGSLFMAGVLINEKDSSKLKKIGAKDSKLIKAQDRIPISKEILKIAKKSKVLEVTPKEIDATLASEDSNLNWLEAQKIAEIINFLKPNKAIIDCPSPNLKAYENYIKKHLNNPDINLIIQHKADAKFPSVGAASLLAKIEREKNVASIEKKVGESIGSGYPSNPICQAFLKKNYKKYPDIFRKSWQTYKKLIKGKSQKKLGEF
jgi:ribonuclease HII|tara:strand:+ start:6537 stop:7193 length:657 start_codon:yes stop_codon:yes gene_type:complete